MGGWHEYALCMSEHWHDRAVIISTGDEITLGQLLDTNARFLAERLTGIGILPIEHITVPDDQDAIARAIERASTLAPLVIMSGGLGPTDGDLTRQAVCQVTGDSLVLDPDALSTLTALLAKRGRAITERQQRQAYRPSRSRTLDNAFGTAPGLHARVQRSGGLTHADLFCLPGPPGELIPMFERGVTPLLRPDPSRTIVTRLLHVIGLPEADCATRLGGLTKRTLQPLVGMTASGGILTIRIRAEGQMTPVEAQSSVQVLVDQVREALGNHVFADGPGQGTQLLCQSVLDLLKKRDESLSTFESCTGGMLGAMLTAIPGSSQAYFGGSITYANKLKRKVGVNEDTLTQHGAVSDPVARELASAGLALTQTNHAIAITGIAGPEGGSSTKPVGTVHIAIASCDRAGTQSADARKFLFTGDREDIRRRACVSALAMLSFQLRSGSPHPLPLLWELR